MIFAGFLVFVALVFLGYQLVELEHNLEKRDRRKRELENMERETKNRSY